MSRGQRAIVAIYAGLAVGFVLATIRAVGAPGGITSTDFTVFSTGWWLILHGQGAALYDPHAQAAAQHIVMGGAQFEGGLLAFLNPPHAAVAGTPFGWLAERTSASLAFATWTACNVVLLWLFDRWLRESIGATAGAKRWTITFALLAFYPVFEVIRLGQVSLLLAVAVLGVYRAVIDSRPVAGAAWLLVLSIKPQLMLPMLVFLAVQRSTRLLMYAAAMSLVTAVATSIVLGPAIWLDYARHITELEQFFATGTPEYMLNVRGALSRAGVLDPPTIERVAFALAITASAILGVMLARQRIHARNEIRAAFAMSVATALLFSPHFFVQDAVIWAVPIVLIAEASWTRESRRPFITAFALGIPVLFAFAHFAESGRHPAPRFPFDAQFAVLVAMMILSAPMLTRLPSANLEQPSC